MDNRTRECSLAQLIEDPLVGLVMKSDGVDRRSIELLFENVARSLDMPGGRTGPEPPTVDLA